MSNFFRRFFGLVSNKPSQSNSSKTDNRAKLELESLEERNLLTVLPAALITDHSTLGAGHSPQVAYDPTNPDNRVVVFASTGDADQNGVNDLVGRYTNDGGETWLPFGQFNGFDQNGNLLPFTISVVEEFDDNDDEDPGTADVPGNPLTTIVDPSVAFDREGNFYVVFIERDAGSNRGIVLMNKYDFDGGIFGDPEEIITTKHLYEWNGLDPARNVIVTVDTSEPDRTLTDPQNSVDPDTGEPFPFSPFVNNVYVAWNTDVTGRASPIKIIASNDGGDTFSTQEYLNDVELVNVVNPENNHSGSSPSLAVDASGNLLAVWNDFQRNNITFDTITDGGVGEFFNRTPGGALSRGFIGDAVAPQSGDHIPNTTVFEVEVNLTEIDTITDMDIVLNINHDNPEALEIRVVAPNGETFILLENRLNAAGQADQATPPKGITGQSLEGQPGSNSEDDFNVGIVFDDDAAREFGAYQTGQIAHFRPEERFSNGIPYALPLSFFEGAGPAAVNGTWELRITDFRDHSPTEPQVVHNWGIRFTGGLTDGTDEIIVTGAGGGAADAPFAADPASPVTGIGPSPVIAIDNTLGSFSPYQDRVYIAIAAIEDIFLLTRDPDGFGGYNTFDLVQVNDDSIADNFSEGNRPQFTPAIDVDPVTGTLVMTWYDTRIDASDIRNTTFITTSIDGGETFSEQTFLNVPKIAEDGITGDSIVIEPIPSNPSNLPDAGFGDRQALVVYGGEVSALWAGNLNSGGSSILTARTRIAAGPRVIGSDQGPVIDQFVYEGGFFDPDVIYNNTFLFDGTRQLDSFRVTFDRPIDPSTFGPDDVTVQFRDPATPTSEPADDLAVAAVTPLDPNEFYGPNFVGSALDDPNHFLATEFLITLADPQFRTGTYSYSIGPDIQDKIRRISTFVTAVGAPSTINSTDTPISIPDNNVAGITSDIAVPAGPGPVVADVNVTVDITHPFVSDLTLTLIAPNGQRVILANGVGGSGDNFTNTKFDDEANQAINDPNDPALPPFTGTFIPEEALESLIGIDPTLGNWTLEVVDSSGGNVGTLNSWSLQITYGEPTETLVEGNFVDQDADSVPLEVPEDTYANPNPLNGIPFQGPYDDTTLPLIIPGPFVLDTSIPGLPEIQQAGSPVTFEYDPFDFFDEGIDGLDPAQILLPLDVDPGQGTLLFDINVQVDLDHTAVGDLGLVLISPDGQRIILANQVGGTDDDFENTIFDDASASSINDAAAQPPFNGTFRPDQPLSDLVGIDPVGTWFLEITDLNPGNGETGTFRNFLLEVTYGSDENLVINNSLNTIDVTFDRDIDASTFTEADILSLIGPFGPIGGPITVMPNPPGTPTALQRRVFRITFPELSFTGNYSIRISSDIQSLRDSESLDNNLNAGLNVLRGIDPNSSDIQTNFFNQTDDLILEPGLSVSSLITIDDTFVIGGQDAQNPVQLGLNIQHPNAPDLNARLIAPDGTVVQLFTGVGGDFQGNRANFSNTLFNDFAGTPIQNGAPPFNGTFLPQLPLSDLVGINAAGVWRLEITNNGTSTGTLTNWNLTFPQVIPGTGLGEESADRFPVLMRIFNQDPTQEVTEQNWVDIGPNPYLNDAIAGVVTAIAVDSSDTSGNTVFVGGATGGVWKTTNFLTDDPVGPTWIPLTDLGPSAGMSIGSIAVFGRNNDANQSIVIAATGDGNTGRAGVGFLRSEDGGQTWQIIDSSNNFDGNGDPLPIDDPSRDRIFSGSTMFKVIVDPTADANGEAIFYAAVSGANGGVYRSLDSGRSWERIGGQANATDVILIPSSENEAGILQNLYAGIEGQGVVFTDSATTASSLQTLPGGTFLTNRRDVPSNAIIPVNDPPSTPSTNAGRISLAAPFRTGNPAQDTLYAGWLYAAVTNPGGGFEGLYVTKNFGANWTRVSLPFVTDQFGNIFGTNDETQPQLDPAQGFGDANLSLTIDPNNPSVVYLGSTVGVIRVDITTIADVFAFVGFDNSDNDGGLPRTQTTGPVDVVNGGFEYIDADPFTLRQNIYNLLRDPDNPFLNDSTLLFDNTIEFNNTGEDVLWGRFNAVFDGVLTGQHSAVSLVDPLTGRTRLLFGSDTGIYTGVDRGNGTLVGDIGTAPIISGTRNGNLHLAELNSGSGQPSSLASDITQSLFYAISRNSAGLQGTFTSENDILQTGILDWQFDFESGEWIEVTQSGNVNQGGAEDGKDVFRFVFPFLADPTDDDYFQINPGGTGNFVSRTTGIAEDPAFLFGSRFAINIADPSALVIGSDAGSVYRTQNKGIQWFEIATPGDLNNAAAQALAFGAPQPNAQSNLSNIVYAGTLAGQIFVTTNAQAGGGNWTNTTPGGLGSPVQQIVTNPIRGTTDAYAVTEDGVFYNSDAAGGQAWVDITGNLFSLEKPLFRDTELSQTTLLELTTIVADWRFQDDNTQTPPILYVGGHGGVFQSVDQGATWEHFPNLLDDRDDGGFLPNVRVTDLNIFLGEINRDTGVADEQTGLNLLMATTEGRGAFVIRLDNENIPVSPQPNDGPRVTGVVANNPPSDNQLPASFDVQFDTDIPVDPNSLSEADFVIRDPNNNIVAVDRLSVSGENRFRVEFTPTVAGPNVTYTINVGPNVSSFSGKLMDQDQDGISGEPLNNNAPATDDVFNGSGEFSVNASPTISAIADQIVPDGQNSTGALNFTISDLEDAGNLLQLSASSSDTNVVDPNTDIIFGGSGNNRTVTINVNQRGGTLITITVTDTNGASTDTVFELRAAQNAVFPFTDDFDRNNNAVLGAEWNDERGDFQVINNTAQSLAPLSVATLDGISDDHVTLQAQLGIVGATGESAGLVARYSGTDTNATAYIGRVAFANGRFEAQIVRLVNGQETILTSQAITGAFGLFRFEVFQESLKLFRNDQLVAFTFDDQITGTGKIGIRGTGSSLIDDFAADEIVPTPTNFPFTDMFTQDDGTSLSRTWSEHAGAFQVQNNQLESFGTGANVASLLLNNPAANADVQADVTLNGTTIKDAGIIARYQGTLNRNFYYGRLRQTGGAVFAQIVRNINGVETVLNQANVTNSVPLGTAVTLRLEILQNNQKLFIDGDLVTFSFDSSLTGIGSVGIKSFGTGSSYDNFMADVNQIVNPVNLPFTDAFNDNTGDTNDDSLAGEWLDRAGAVEIQGDQAHGAFAGQNLTALNGVNEREISLQANVNVANGVGSAGLVARYSGPALNNFYVGSIVNDGQNRFARISINNGGTLTTLAQTQINATQGLLRFELFGNSLKLFLDNVLQVTAFSGALNSGSAGMHFTNTTSTLDNFNVDEINRIDPVNLPFTDNFDDTNGSILGGEWQDRSGAFQIQNNMAQGFINGYNLTTLNGLDQADIRLQANVNVNNGVGSTRFGGLVARYNGTVVENFYLGALVSENGNLFARIWKNVGGNFSVLSNQAVNDGQGVLRFELEGPSLRLFLNNVLVGQAVDSSFASGSAGILSFNGGPTFDNFSAEEIIVQNANLPFNDTFTGNDGDTLDDTWRNRSGGVEIQQNQAEGVQSGVYNFAALNGVDERDIVIEANIDITAAGSSAGLVGRYSGTILNNFYMAEAFNNGSTTTVRIFRNSFGSFSLLGQGQINSPTGTLRFELFGNNLKAFFNDDLIVSTYDGTPSLNSGSAGVVFFGNNGALDNFNADAINRVTPVNLPFNDSFDGTNDDPLARQWQDRTGGFEIQNNMAQGFFTGYNMASLNGLNQGDIAVEAFVDVTGVTGNNHGGLFARYTGTIVNNFYWGDLLNDGNNTRAIIYKNVGGNFQILSSEVVGTDAGVSGVLRFELIGNNLKLFLDGVTVGSAFDSQFTTGSAGILSFNTGARFDNFSAIANPQQNAALNFGPEAFNGNNGEKLPATFRDRTGTFQINSTNEATGTFAGYNMAALNGINVADVSVEAFVDISGANNNRRGGLVARYSGNILNNFYWAQISDNGINGPVAEIYRNVGGNFQRLGNAVSINQQSGLLRFDVVGNTLTLFLDGNQILQRTDNTFATGSVGMLSFNPTPGSVVFDNFSADAI